ncbi:hypothetical protein EDB81DRAFT_226591 [Dactylonectria macrodidyma]|uniref:C2H2-type domain-containing protein n=1 Tax=Dactylonectria macrodidyma TaxID=307937 RepID=A0A9P9IJT8_9HYPO|nr:hypothetical protein EDB81DRAFT_226591 [Dactylonectria macrodidyma]
MGSALPLAACALCGRLFARKCHMRRHEATHSGPQHPCQFCGKAFARSDVARRHAQSCATRTRHEPLQKAKRGRKPHACGRCFTQKLSCGPQRPCLRCLRHGLPCTGVGVGVESNSSSTSSASPDGNHVDHTSLFLEITDPKLQYATGFLGSKEPWCNRKMRHHLEQYAPHSDQDLGAPTLDIPFWGFDDPLSDLLLDDSRYRNSALLPNQHPTCNLEFRLNQLTTDLREVCTTHPSIGQGLSFSVTNYTAILSVENFLNLVDLFFVRWHSQWPILHWPTFDLEKASLPLLLAVALSGAAFSRAEDSVETDPVFAKAFYQTAEAYIFDRLDALCSPADGIEPILNDDTIEVCQAALLVEVIQKSVNDTGIRRRMFAKRHPTLVAALRSLGILGVKHRDSTMPSWGLFIREELLVRLAIWTFLTDALPTLFCNQPPSMILSEMIGDLPCDEKLWNAATETDFSKEWRKTTTTQHRPSVQQLVTNLFDDNWDHWLRGSRGRLSVDHLNIMIWALQPIIFNLRTTVPMQSSLSRVLRALHRWWSAWDDTPQSNRVGLASHAPELARLTKNILEAGLRNDAKFSTYLSGLALEDTMHIHELIKAVRVGDQSR